MRIDWPSLSPYNATFHLAEIRDDTTIKRRRDVLSSVTTSSTVAVVFFVSLSQSHIVSAHKHLNKTL